jgi:hypothetical protein
VTIRLWSALRQTVAIDGTAAHVVLQAGRNGIVEFNGVQGEYLGIGITAAATTPEGRSFNARVFDPSGTQVASFSAGGPASANVPRLAASGIYSLHLGTLPGTALDADVIVSRALTGTLNPNTPVLYTSERIGQDGRYAIAPEAGGSFSVRFNDVTFAHEGRLRIVNEQDQEITSNIMFLGWDFAITLEALPAGTYFAVVDPVGTWSQNSANPGQVQLTVVPDASGCVPTGGVPLPITLTPAQNGNFTFNATEGEDVTVRLEVLEATPVRARVRSPTGSVIADSWFTNDPQLPLSDLPEGTYTLFVDPQYVQTTNISISLE